MAFAFPGPSREAVRPDSTVEGAGWLRLSIDRSGVRVLALSCLLLASAAASGCVAVAANVGNPIPGMTTVAVAPFFNLSAEPTVDGRRFALAYYSELQKTSNYQVLPVGVVEDAIRENELEMGSPADVVRLAKILDVDAVVVGAVTEYVPYYPPQMALHIQWYTAREWAFLGPAAPPLESDIPCPPDCPPGYPSSYPFGSEDCPVPVSTKGGPTVRAQSPEPDENGTPQWLPPGGIQLAQSSGKRPPPPVDGQPVWPARPDPTEKIPRPMLEPPSQELDGRYTVKPQPDAPQPVMSYTRFFDGGDKRLTKLLKAYYHLRGDMRSGGWEAYLHRSDDFLRFTAHVMIVEMMSIHGAPLETDYYFRYWNWK